MDGIEHVSIHFQADRDVIPPNQAEVPAKVFVRIQIHLLPCVAEILCLESEDHHSQFCQTAQQIDDECSAKCKMTMGSLFAMKAPGGNFPMVGKSTESSRTPRAMFHFKPAMWKAEWTIQLKSEHSWNTSQRALRNAKVVSHHSLST